MGGTVQVVVVVVRKSLNSISYAVDKPDILVNAKYCLAKFGC